MGKHLFLMLHQWVPLRWREGIYSLLEAAEVVVSVDGPTFVEAVFQSTS